MGWTERDLVTIGYVPLRPPTPPAWLGAPAVQCLCSVTTCNAGWPPRWFEQWKHNELQLFDTPTDALGVVEPAERASYLCFAIRALPIVFDGEHETDWVLPAVRPEAVPSTYEFLGFDVVQWQGVTGLECSPLSCNRMAGKFHANRWCLLDTIEQACAAARAFAHERVEPGPYVVLAVSAERRPDVQA